VSVQNSASTQFHSTLGAAPQLDRIGFSAPGRVAKGMGVAGKMMKASVVSR